MSRSISETYLARYAAVVGPDDDAVFPLTGAQRRFVLARALAPGQSPDLVPLFFVFPRGTIDLARLRRAAVRVASGHTALRGAVVVRRGTPVLCTGAPSVETRELPVPPGATAAQAVGDALRAWRADGPVFRLFVARPPGEEHELLAIVLDHVVCDEPALATVVAGLTEAYEDPAPAAAAAADGPAYREAVTRQLAAEQAASSPAALEHWAARLAPLDGPGPEPDRAAPRENGMLSRRLPAASGRVRGLVFPALLDAFSAALRGPGARPALGYPWGGAPLGAPAALGCFFNTVVHPAEPSPGIERTTAAWWDDLDRADTPFDEVVRAVRRAGGRWAGQLAGILTVEDTDRRAPLRLGGVAGRETHVAVPLRYAAPIGLSVSHGAEMVVRLVWDRAHLGEDAAAAAFASLLETVRGHLTPVQA